MFYIIVNIFGCWSEKNFSSTGKKTKKNHLITYTWNAAEITTPSALSPGTSLDKCLSAEDLGPGKSKVELAAQSRPVITSDSSHQMGLITQGQSVDYMIDDKHLHWSAGGEHRSPCGSPPAWREEPDDAVSAPSRAAADIASRFAMIVLFW